MSYWASRRKIRQDACRISYAGGRNERIKKGRKKNAQEMGVIMGREECGKIV